MKFELRLLAISAVLAAGGYAGAAYADDITIDPHPFVSSASRTQVQKELLEFKRSGVDPWALNYDHLRHFQSTRTRNQVTAEFIRYRDAVAAMHGEDSGSSYLAGMRSRTYAPVHLATDGAAKATR